MPREIIWWGFEKKDVSSRYTNITKDMYNKIITRVRTMGGEIDTRPITVSVYLGSAFPCLLSSVMEEHTRHTQEKVCGACCLPMIFILVDETRKGIVSKVQKQREDSESK